MGVTGKVEKMRIVIDLQGAQASSRGRGIGRYSLSLAQAIARNRGEHEVFVVLNGMFPATIESLRAAFAPYLPHDCVKVWDAQAPVQAVSESNSWRKGAAEIIREVFLASLQPDIVYITSVFEGYLDNAVISARGIAGRIPTAVTCYDAIPLMQSDEYFKYDSSYKKFYFEKLECMKGADLHLAISESSRKESITYFGSRPETTFNVGSAVGSYFVKTAVPADKELQLRTRLGISRPFIMYSGADDKRKNLPALIAAFGLLPDEVRMQHQLVLAGGMSPVNARLLKKCVRDAGLAPDEVVFTDRISDSDLLKLYNLCELFVMPSWHEGFGLPPLEAMSCGAAVIGANATSLPEVLGRSDMLFDPFSKESIAGKIMEVLTNPGFRDELRRYGLEQSKSFSWDISARKAISAMEDWYASGQSRVQVAVPQPKQLVVDSIGQLLKGRCREKDLLGVASAIARSYPEKKRQLLIDISELVRSDAKTGIQRVGRSVLLELLENPPSGFEVEPVYSLHGSPYFYYARAYKNKLSNILSDEELEGHLPVELSDQDIFIGLDLNLNSATLRQFVAELKHVGVPTYFVVYDLLPVRMPECFAETLPDMFGQWLEVIAGVDGLICISRAVADELVEWLDDRKPARFSPLDIGWFHLGADIGNSVPTTGMPDNAQEVLDVLRLRKSFLVVGTIEPRKGYAQVLAAFELLWARGVDVNLVLVGKKGWRVDDLYNRIMAHPELNKRLFCLSGISDEYLEKVYAHSDCLIAASLGEGYGLPLIEAAQRKVPIIARNMPVFREVVGNHGFYFDGLAAEDLFAVVEEWLLLDKDNNAPQSVNLPWLTWEQSTVQLLNAVLGGKWYRQWGQQMPEHGGELFDSLNKNIQVRKAEA